MGKLVRSNRHFMTHPHTNTWSIYQFSQLVVKWPDWAPFNMRAFFFTNVLSSPAVTTQVFSSWICVMNQQNWQPHWLWSRAAGLVKDNKMSCQSRKRGREHAIIYVSIFKPSSCCSVLARTIPFLLSWCTRLTATGGNFKCYTSDDNDLIPANAMCVPKTNESTDTSVDLCSTLFPIMHTDHKKICTKIY